MRALLCRSLDEGIDGLRVEDIPPPSLPSDGVRIEVHAAAMNFADTLLVRGRMSDLLSEEGAREMLALTPHAEYADVAGAGHMVAGDRNDVFAATILDFLARRFPAERAGEALAAR